ncbi:MAG: hypothetical protein GXO97_07670 [Nitrospirae bacterium]|nr:hypothetical protein [Nitrospirota bacterium]
MDQKDSHLPFRKSTGIASALGCTFEIFAYFLLPSPHLQPGGSPFIQQIQTNIAVVNKAYTIANNP